MKIIIAYYLFILALFPVAVTAQEEIPANATAFYEKAISKINPKYVSWIKQTAASANKNNQDENAINTMASNYGQQFGLGESDIMALAFIVMMEASKSAREDLKAIMDGVKNINKEKEDLRTVSNQTNKYSAINGSIEMPRTTLDSFRLLTRTVKNNKQNAVAQPSRIQNNQIQKTNLIIAKQAASPEELQQLKEEIKNKLDSLNELSESASLRLQMMMDRRSKMMSALSNIMKKISDTQDSIISNLK